MKITDNVAGLLNILIVVLWWQKCLCLGNLSLYDLIIIIIILLLLFSLLKHSLLTELKLHLSF